MITFTQLGRYGRLGNQLFQYAVLKSVALERGLSVKIPDPETMIWQNQKCYLRHFNLECDYLDPVDYSKIKYRFQELDHARFYSEVFNVSDYTDLYGFFQNYQYFSKYEKQISKELNLKNHIKELAKNYINNIRNMGDSTAEIVSVHMRRGDSCDGTHPEFMNFFGEGDILTKESNFGKYFFRALEQFSGKNVKFLVFSGGSRLGDKHNQSDIDWCKDNFQGDNIYYSEGNTDLVDFEIMRQCDHNITSHMTSFGWWAAFLNDNPEKIVTAPQNYSIPDDGRVSRGFYPPQWSII